MVAFARMWPRLQVRNSGGFTAGTEVLICAAMDTIVRSRTDKNVWASAPVKVVSLRGGSPRQEEVWPFVAEGNCVAARRGGEHPEANDPSVITANRLSGSDGGGAELNRLSLPLSPNFKCLCRPKIYSGQDTRNN